MITMKQLKEEDIAENLAIFQAVIDLFGKYDGLYYKYEIDGKEKILHRIDDLFTILYYEEDNAISYEMFTVDDDYNIVELGCDDYEVSLSYGTPIFTCRQNGNYESLYLIDRKNSVDVDGYNGAVVYIQYSKEFDVRVSITYQITFYGNGQIIRKRQIEEPFSILFEKDLNKKLPMSSAYVVKKAREGSYAYDMMSIKDFGLKEFLEKGSYELQKEKEIYRYFKIIARTPNNFNIILFPFCKQYNKQEMFNKIKKYKLNTEVPEFILNFYNNKYKPLEEYVELASVMEKVEINEEFNPQILKMKYGGKNE